MSVYIPHNEINLGIELARESMFPADGPISRYDKGRCAAFVDRVMNHYENGAVVPQLFLSETRRTLDIVCIHRENAGFGVVHLQIDCKSESGQVERIEILLEEANVRLVDFHTKKGEKCLGWEHRNVEIPIGFFCFKRPSSKSESQ